MVGEEARALGAVKEELPNCPAIIPSQLLHQLRQEEGHLQVHPYSACPRAHMQAFLMHLGLKHASLKGYMPMV